VCALQTRSTVDCQPAQSGGGSHFPSQIAEVGAEVVPLVHDGWQIALLGGHHGPVQMTESFLEPAGRMVELEKG
jgi:hypothetical protein